MDEDKKEPHAKRPTPRAGTKRVYRTRRSAEECEQVPTSEAFEQVAARVPSDLNGRFKEAAKSAGITKAAAVEEAMRMWLENKGLDTI